ncbi:hypothetical protein BJ508DRAFT_413652 [Ascobolus immersus RN42]|uniref:Uncharacterized protein n=1 Tax=Ascobolus immersus RN42 TaxID=1160509 RepID=A0A3N4IB17_ASCIM|nr:hypothetical protein BJ508DRAFT_413652 [Ascobolus immersus RN42]
MPSSTAVRSAPPCGFMHIASLYTHLRKYIEGAPIRMISSAVWTIRKRHPPMLDWKSSTLRPLNSDSLPNEFLTTQPQSHANAASSSWANAIPRSPTTVCQWLPSERNLGLSLFIQNWLRQ